MASARPSQPDASLQALVEPMGEGDVPWVAELAASSFPVPWDVAAFRNELQRPWARLRVIRGAEGVPVAYAVSWCLQGEMHLLSLATSPDQRRLGLGSRLVGDLIEFGRERGLDRVTLEVRAANRAAQALYRRWSFVTLGRRPRYYEDGSDAILMVCPLRRVP